MRFLFIFVTCLSLFADASRLRRLGGSNSDGGSLGDSDNPLTLPNQLLYLDSTVPGTVVQDSAVQFTAGDKAYLSIADNAALSMGTNVSFTIAGWVYLDSTASSYRYIVNKGIAITSAPHLEYSVGKDTANKFYVAVSDGSTIYTATWGSAAATATWYFIAATFNDSTGTLALNINQSASPITTTSVTYSQDLSYALWIGGRNDGYNWDGRMDTLAIWKRVLSSTELDWQYNSGAGRIYSDYTDAMKVGLVSCWDFNEENGTRYDSRSTNHLAQTFVELVSNGTFTGNSTGWTEGAGWAYGSNNEAGTATTADLTQSVAAVSGHKYKKGFTIVSVDSGSLAFNFGGVTGTTRTTAATFTEYVTATSTASIAIHPVAAFTGVIDDVTLTCTEIPSAAGIAAGWAKDGNLCASFNGTSQYLYCNSNTNLQTGDIDFTVWGWCNLAAKNASAYPSLLYKGPTTTNKEYQLYYDGPSDRFVFAVYPQGTLTGATYLSDSTTGSPVVNNWYFIVVWQDTAADKIWIQCNNSTAVSANFTGLVARDGNFGVAAASATIPIRAQGVGFKKRILTPTERTALFNNGIGIRGSSELPSSMTSDVATYPMSYWPLEEYSAGTANITRSDAVGANHLTSVGNTPSGQGVDYYGGAVSKWYDLSGNNRTFTQTTIASRLMYSGATIGNQYSLVGDGGTKSLSYASDFISTNDVTLFAVIKPRGWGGGNYGRIFDNGKCVLYNSNLGYLTFHSDGLTGVNSGSSSIVLNSSYVLAVTRSSSGTANFFINGLISGAGNQSSGTPATGSAVYLMNTSTGTRGFDGWLQKLIIVNGILSQSKIQAVSQQLMRENGI